MERHPSRFMLRELNGEQPMPWRRVSRLREASDQVAAFLGSRGDDLVFVPNVTTGLNAVLGSLPLGAGDEIVITDLAYGAVALGGGVKSATCRRDAPNGPHRVSRPRRRRGGRIDRQAPSRRRRSSSSSITSPRRRRSCCRSSAIAAECRARGMPVLVDGAHAPGSRPLDIPSLGVDWYAANLHKWAHAPRSCGVLWAAPERQSILRVADCVVGPR